MDSADISPVVDAEVRQQYYQNASPTQHQLSYGSYAEPSTNTKYTEDNIQKLIHSNNYELRRTQSTKSLMWSCYRRIFNKQLDHYTGWIVCLVCRQRKPMHPKSPVREFEEHAAVCMQTEAGAAIREILSQPGSFEIRVASTRNGVTHEVLTQKTLRLIAKIASRIVTDKQGDLGNGTDNLAMSAASSTSDIALNITASGGRSTRSTSDMIGNGSQNMLVEEGGSRSDVGTPRGTPPGSDTNVLVRSLPNNKRPFPFSQPATSAPRPVTRSSDTGAIPAKRFASAVDDAERANTGGSNPTTNATEPPISPSASPNSPQRLSFQNIAVANGIAAADAVVGAANGLPHAHAIKSVVMLRYNLGKGWSDAVCSECCLLLPAKPAAGDRESLHLTALREVAEEEGKPLDADGLRYRLPLDGVSAVNKIVNAGFHVRNFMPLMADEICYLLESIA